MNFYSVVDHAIALLRQRGRVTYRALKRQFALDDDALADLTEELIYGQRLAADEGGRVLVGGDVDPTVVIVIGLIAFGVIFALNSAVHSYLILAYAQGDKVAMNVGFYYMANACGRLAGTVLSGALYQWRGLEACLWASAMFVLAAGALSLLLPRTQPRRAAVALK